MIDLIPAPYRILAACLVAGLALAAAAAGGAVVNGWRLDADHQRAMTAEKGRYDLLADQVREQNRAVEVMGASTKAAQDQAELAKRYNVSLAAVLDRRATAVTASKATNCDGVLRDAWGWK